MGGTTANWQIPYPTGTDRVMDGDNAMKAIADRVDAILTAQPPMASGAASVSLSNAASGAVAVTFPAGRFTSNPAVVTNPSGSSIYFGYVAGNVTPSGATLGVRTFDARLVTASITVYYLAREYG